MTKVRSMVTEAFVQEKYSTTILNKIGMSLYVVQAPGLPKFNNWEDKYLITVYRHESGTVYEWTIWENDKVTALEHGTTMGSHQTVYAIADALGKIDLMIEKTIIEGNDGKSDNN